MTREVAIDHLKADIKYWENTSVSTEHLYMAIKALEQEPFKPMVEIDLYSVIKQKYIEREVLDKIGDEIEDLYSYADFDWDTETCYNMVRLEEVQRVIDKHKVESEEEEIKMTNKEMMKEIFGIEHEEKVRCSADLTKKCIKYCPDVLDCSNWLNSEYKKEDEESEDNG